MTLLMRDRANVRKGEEIGEDKLAKLIMLLNQDNRPTDIVRVAYDKEYRRKLFLEYGL